ncbi:YihY/virulence factor BrkB family protein [Georgenia sp. TF02-10]|uniref:YihY/virulence factor BrkB family protein n=1 Tax=Georgenia sp. TF02-10 TaxID=2917725 RepID=UPI001FA817D5|nr:YihY/virulence factor BrkB family protein [Georgenia sp. TF02-10]UNX55329.1 YihY/virulence factor BrkB family protein [Georgenia sp. TF02-10]
MTQQQVRPVRRQPYRRHVVAKAARQFLAHECWDRAAGMTFFAVLSVPPLAIALTSVLALLGEGRSGTAAVLEILAILSPDEEALETVSQPVLAVLRQPAAGVALLVGLVTAVWMSAGYVGALGRAINMIYGISEGRPMWKLQATHLLTTVVLLAFAILVVLLLVVSGPVARALGEVLGLGTTVVHVWEAVRWPMLLLAAVTVVAVLYYASPNIEPPRFRPVSPGAVLALLVAAVASFGLRLYVTTAGRFEINYGVALAGVVVFFIWLWIINMALLFGAEVDHEVERVRQLKAGIPADRDLRVRVRDTRASRRAARQRAADEARARNLREHWGDGAE